MNNLENKKQQNSFDNIILDIGKVYDSVSQPAQKCPYPRHSAIFNNIKMYFNGFLLKTKIYPRLLYSNLILGWFLEFNKFWLEIIKGRYIDVIDFHCLKFHYRRKYQNIGFDNSNEENNFLDTWQKQENLSMLFQWIWRYAKSAYLNFYPFLKYLPKNAKILEYGCGLAPITKGLIKYQSHKNFKFTIADIKWISFLYAIFTFKKYQEVDYVTLTPFKNTVDKSNYFDAIVCTEVFEHLPNGFEVMKSFNDNLKSGGILIFDYIKGDADGLNTQKGVENRELVLRFIKNNFKILSGKIDINESVGLTVVRKLNNK